ncbi:MAG: DGQHR domain-containing protein [Dehalococcoidia bacterium]
MGELSKLFFKNLVTDSELKKEYRNRKQQYIFGSIHPSLLQEYEQNGWERQKESKTRVRVRKKKPVDENFEDQIWRILADMGFTYMNTGRQFKLPYSDDYKLTQQVDVIAIDQETILIVECKAAETVQKNRSFKEAIEAIGGKKEGILSVLRKIFPDSKHRVKFIFATDKYTLTEPDEKRLANFDIAHFQEHETKYYGQLTAHLGQASKYQLLGSIFAGKTIPGLDNKVPAIRGKLGPYTIYLFTIEPERLLKIGYVLHRSKANIKLMPTYQRIIKRARINSIESFLNSGGFFPNSVTIAIDTEEPMHFDLSNTQCDDSICRLGILHLPKQYRTAYIIDGQHRVFGYAKSKYGNTNTIPVVAFENLDRTKQLDLFLQINENQKTVSVKLRHTLNADILWNSPDVAKAVKSLKLNVVIELGENNASPLYNKIIIGEDPKTPTRCITIDTLYEALDKSNFFGIVTKDSIKQMGTFYDGNNESTLNKLSEYLIGCLDYIREHLAHEWEQGENDDGFLAINSTMFALIIVISSISDHLVKTQGINPRLEKVESLVTDTTPYLDPLIRYFTEISPKGWADLRKTTRGSGGRLDYAKKLQQVINADKSEFNPEGLEQYIKDNSRIFNTKSFEMIRDIELSMKDDIFTSLKAEYGDKNWWRKGVPLDVYQDAEKLASTKNRDIDDPNKEVYPWDQLHFIDYRKIILNNWSKLFQQKYSFPDAKGDKQEKTKWLEKINGIRNDTDHVYSVSEEEYNFLKQVYDWFLIK